MRKRMFLTCMVLGCLSVITGKRIFVPTMAHTSGMNEPEVRPSKNLQPLLREFEQFIRYRMEKEHIPGVAVAVVKDTNIIYLKTFGLRERLGYDSVNIHTVFRLASVSKGFAPVLAGMLVKEGLLNLDDRVIDYLPDFSLSTPMATQTLTLRHVLSHTTGLPRHAYSNLLDQGLPYMEIRNRLSRVRLTHEVGAYYNYQNVAYSLIGEIIERVTGKTYEELLRERIFLPLNMRDASAGYAPMLRCNNAAVGHRYGSRGYYSIDLSPNYYCVGPAAGVNASITDMASWMMFLLGRRPDVLAPDMLDEIFQPHVDLPAQDLRHWHGVMQKAYYGLGWRVLDCGSDRLIYHGGYVNGYRSEIALNRKDGFGIVVLTNAPSAFISTCLPTFFEYYQLYKHRNWDPIIPLATMASREVESNLKDREE